MSGSPSNAHRAERDVAQALMPDVAWPTLVLGVLLPVAYLGLIGLGLAGGLPLWLCCVVQGPLAYMHYMLVHESLHHNLAPGRPPLKRLEAVLGWIGALVLLSSWPLARRTHIAHHANTNGPKDPDLFVKGSFAKLLMTWLRSTLDPLVPFALLRWRAPSRYLALRSLLTRAEWLQANAAQASQLVLLAAAASTGHFVAYLALWFVPARIGSLLLMIFFQWLPHHPHSDTGRYTSGRLSFWPGAELALMWQNLHLMHHLWPRVPFYRLGRLYEGLRPKLIQRGVRHEGLRPGSTAKGRLAGQTS